MLTGAPGVNGILKTPYLIHDRRTVTYLSFWKQVPVIQTEWSHLERFFNNLFWLHIPLEHEIVNADADIAQNVRAIIIYSRRPLQIFQLLNQVFAPGMNSDNVFLQKHLRNTVSPASIVARNDSSF